MDIDEFTARSELIKARLYRTALLYVGSESLALDAVSEAVYKGLKSFRKLRRPEFFETWLTRIMINECKKELRRRKREQALETLPETAAEAFDALPLKEAIGRLPSELREVVILRYFTGFTLAQTARSLDIPQGTAATRQRRALALLKLELSEED
jgi:RNA polymerase sigma-70 factor (ECF subfamily)